MSAARAVSVAATLLILAQGAAACGRDEPAPPQSRQVDGFTLRSADLPAGYKPVRTPAGCATHRTKVQLAMLHATRCASAMFFNDTSRVFLFAYRFDDARRASAALPRMRRSAVRRYGYRTPIIGVDEGVFWPRSARHSLAASGLGDEAPRGVRLDRGDGRDLYYSALLFLWRHDAVVAGLTVSTDGLIEGGLAYSRDTTPSRSLGDIGPAALLRIARQIDARARTAKHG